MFPLDETIKRKIMEIVGGRLSKHGDSYDKGSAFFTRASQILDELDRKYHLAGEVDINKTKLANGMLDPKYKHFKPVLKPKGVKDQQ